ncbi:hypothetical protein GEMRC1_006249 [Eukaryota sp. GEM-RC1]
MSTPNNKVVVCDMGTGYIKTGFAGDQLPRHKFPSVVGRPLLRADESFGDSATIPDILVGDDCMKHLSILDVSHPLENGVVKNWDDMRELYGYMFKNKLQVDPSECSVLLTEAANTPVPAKKRMMEEMFEYFNIPRAQIFIQALLTLFAQGTHTGIVVDSGDGVTHLMPVYEGCLLDHLVKRIDIAGRDLTRYLMKLLLRQGYSLNRTNDFEAVRDMKEKHCYCSVHPEIDASLAAETTALIRHYDLPDGQKVTLDRERFEAVEPLFRPDLIGKEVGGVGEQLFDLIHASPMDVRPTFYRSIYVSGGSTMFPGFPDRLENDLKTVYKERILKGVKDKSLKIKIEVGRSPQRMNHVFSGASLLADLSKNRDEFWIHKHEWEEQGVHRCLERLGKLPM